MSNLNHFVRDSVERSRTPPHARSGESSVELSLRLLVVAVEEALAAIATGDEPLGPDRVTQAVATLQDMGIRLPVKR